MTRRLLLQSSLLNVKVMGESGIEQRDSMRSGDALKRVQWDASSRAGVGLPIERRSARMCRAFSCKSDSVVAASESMRASCVLENCVCIASLSGERESVS